ncbi:MAG TPA: serine/threonine-protein kinase, partial [Thermoanaerobaculia bacterium]|nr:serine/threonine-protein kinase [Thermoanaerobaculia bacterium]
MAWFGKKTTEVGSNPADPAAAKGEEPPRRKIGKYEILEKIASGGFGTVYKAWDPMIKRAVALKTCELPDAVMRARVFREAQLAGGLQHPNITTVFEFGVDGIVPFLAQELLSGEDLDKAIARGAPATIEEKVRVLIAVASALECAHAAGIVHRDVKPPNVRILDTGTVKIMDFGIAKSLDSTTSSLTRDGMAIGSTSYMSPEQIVGDPVDFRTDLFSLGVVAYELVTGKKPFAHTKLFLLLEQIVKTEPVPVLVAAPGTPPRLAALIERAMAKKPEERFASAAEFKAELEAVLAEPAAKALPAPQPARAAGSILVVDDDERVRDAVRVLLEGEGYLVDAAGDGAAGIERLESTDVCLVLLDLAMPGMDGWQFLERQSS